MEAESGVVRDIKWPSGLGTGYRECQPMPAEAVEGGFSMRVEDSGALSLQARDENTRVEDSGALLQQVEGPNGLPRGGTTSWAPRDLWPPGWSDFVGTSILNPFNTSGRGNGHFWPQKRTSWLRK